MRVECAEVSLNQLKRYTRLDDHKFRHAQGLFLAEGIKVVEELLLSNWQTEAILVLPEKIKYWRALLDKTAGNIPIYSITGSQLKKISQDKEPEGIIAVVRMNPAPDLSSFLSTTEGNILILHEINNPANIGALLRSALWFGFTNIMLSTNCADYTNPKTVRTSMGSLFHVNIAANITLKKVLPEIKKSYYLVGSNVHRGQAPHLLQKKAALLLGSESHGLPDDLLDMVDEQWSIPGSGKVDSLSLPQAAAILMYECTKR